MAIKSLERGHVDGLQGVADRIEQVSDSAAECLRADSNGEGDENDEHSVFGGRGTALLPVKPLDQTQHLTSPRALRPRNTHSADAHL